VICPRFLLVNLCLTPSTSVCVCLDCSGESNPISSQQRAIGLADIDIHYLLVVSVTSPGRAAPVEVRVGPAAACGDMALSPCVPNKPAGSGSKLLFGERKVVGEGLVDALERIACLYLHGVRWVEVQEILHSKVLKWTF
jgi:hypothetical protein